MITTDLRNETPFINTIPHPFPETKVGPQNHKNNKQKSA